MRRIDYYRISKDHPEDHNPPEAGGEMSVSFGLVIAQRKRLSALPVRTAQPHFPVMGRFVLVMGLMAFRHGAFCFHHEAFFRPSWSRCLFDRRVLRIDRRIAHI